MFRRYPGYSPLSYAVGEDDAIEVVETAIQSVDAKSYLSEIKGFYTRNIEVISIVQSVLIMFLIIKLIKR